MAISQRRLTLDEFLALPERKPALEYRALARLPVEVDVLVYAPREILEWSAVDQAFVTTAVREGLVVYERSA